MHQHRFARVHAAIAGADRDPSDELPGDPVEPGGALAADRDQWRAIRVVALRRSDGDALFDEAQVLGQRGQSTSARFGRLARSSGRVGAGRHGNQRLHSCGGAIDPQVLDCRGNLGDRLLAWLVDQRFRGREGNTSKQPPELLFHGHQLRAQVLVLALQGYFPRRGWRRWRCRWRCVVHVIKYGKKRKLLAVFSSCMSQHPRHHLFEKRRHLHAAQR